LKFRFVPHIITATSGTNCRPHDTITLAILAAQRRSFSAAHHFGNFAVISQQDCFCHAIFPLLSNYRTAVP
jgi:hypothetical protein